MARRPLVAGNWKMNGLKASRAELDAMLAGHGDSRAETLICPPATLIAGFAEAAEGHALSIGGQDCHVNAAGAHTGDLSAAMLADAGATAVILGHSERRADHGESDALVRDKVEAAWAEGLTAIICVGETEGERDAGEAFAVVADQIAGSVPEGSTPDRTVIAYEPVWAIGTGRTASISDIASMHARIRTYLAAVPGADATATRVLYGGSVKPGNAAEIFEVADVDGALVGGASLKASDYLAIVAAAG
ncbi:MAG: triose-phosphate isomerase [Pseudomonadota bacterium]